MPSFYIFHGWGADSQSNWFETFRRFLVDRGQTCHVPDFPNSQYPVYAEWEAHLQEHYPPLDEQSVIMGHSLGSGFIQRYLTDNDVRGKAAILVAPTVTNCGIHEIRDFFTKPFDYEKIKNSAEQITIFASSDDPFIPVSEVEMLGEKLDIEPMILENREHLWSPNFPELEELLQSF